MRRFTALLISVWLGLHIGFGFIAAPVAFNSLHQLADGRQMAGDIAGMLFHCADLFGIAAWLFAAVITRQDARLNYNVKSRTSAWINVLLVCLAVNEFLFAPVIAALKHNQSNWLHNLIGGGMGVWHGSAYVVYCIVALIGLGLCIRLLRWVPPH